MTLAPPIKNYIRGDSRTISIQVYQTDGSTPFDLTGCTVYFTVNPNTDPGSNDTAAIVQKQTTTAGTSGIATITLNNSDTQSWTPGTYYYDIQLKDSSGNITSLQQNTFQVVADITRRTS